MKTRKRTRFEGSGGTLFCAAFVFLAATAIPSSAQTFTTLLDFDVTNGGNPVDLIQGFDGNFYGTTDFGGTGEFGTAFKVTPSGVLTTLHSFCSKGRCPDGQVPAGGLTQASNGDFYGPTNNGGTSGLGVIFRVTTTGNFVVLYNFCSSSPCADGEGANGLIQARNGNLYGTSPVSMENLGTVFELSLSGKLTILHAFSGSDGSYPVSALVQASNGNLYGTTTKGGSSTNCSSGGVVGCGTVFEIMPSGTLTTLHSFDGTDGEYPGYSQATLIQGADGYLYGFTNGGGSGVGNQCAYGCGTVFKISLTGQFTKLYNFCSLPNCSDGSGPSSLEQGTDGNLYGSTWGGGNSTGSGTIFKITPQGVLTTLYDFCSQANCADGANPQAVMQATDGNFYGVTNGGGPSDWGTIYRVSMGLGPFAKLLRDSGRVGQRGGILGQGFTGTTGVFVNGTPASFNVVSDTYIEATVPAGATSGFVTVSTPTGTLTSNVVFHVGP